MSAPRRQFRDALRSLVPPRLRDGGPFTPSIGFKFLWVFAAVLDAILEWMTQGAQARLPGLGTPTALGAEGRARGIRRGLAEPDASYVARLLRWLDSWRYAGHPFSILRELRAYINAPVRVRCIDYSGNWHTIDEAGVESSLHLGVGAWNWEGVTGRWWDLWIIVYPGTLWPVWETWDGSQWSGDFADDQDTIGQEAPYDVCEDIRAIVRERKPKHCVCRNIIIAYDPADFNPLDAGTLPDGTWGAPCDDSDPPELTRNQNARYWEGVI